MISGSSSALTTAATLVPILSWLGTYSIASAPGREPRICRASSIESGSIATMVRLTLGLAITPSTTRSSIGRPAISMKHLWETPPAWASGSRLPRLAARIRAVYFSPISGFPYPRGRRLGSELARQWRSQSAYPRQLWQICKSLANRLDRGGGQQADRAAVELRPEILLSERASEATGGPGHRRLEAASVFQHHLHLGWKFALCLVDRIAVDAGIERSEIGPARRLVGEIGERGVTGEQDTGQPIFQAELGLERVLRRLVQ